MPYEGWHCAKPNIFHLREFGAPVWILLQGQKEQRKMLPKSKRRVYVGFDDGTHAVRYYNEETHKVLTSCNFCNITPPDHPTPPQPIKLTPDMPHEGEIGGNMLPMGVTGSDDRTCNLEPKRNEIEEDVDIDAPWKTRGICTNYQKLTCGIRTEHQNLHDPFTEASCPWRKPLQLSLVMNLPA
jgi:hypothetical protein